MQLICSALHVPHTGTLCNSMVPHLKKSPACLTVAEQPDGVRGLPKSLVNESHVSNPPCTMALAARMALTHLSVSR